MATQKPIKKSNYMTFKIQKQDDYFRDVDNDLQTLFTYLSTFPSVYTQSLEPALKSDSLGFWKDSDDGKFYWIVNIAGTQKKIELI